MQPPADSATHQEPQSGAVSRRIVLTGAGGVAGALMAEAPAQAATPGPAPLPRPAGEVDRAFVRIREGLVHYRHTMDPGGARRGRALPLYMVHAGPGSSRGMASLMAALAPARTTIAPDTLGNGDSAAPGVADPDIAYYADSVVRILDALGLEQVDYYGAHAGAHIGCELALRYPDRVRRLIFDGVTVRTPELRAELLANYAPKMQPDDYGRHLQWAWGFVRDMSLFFPHYARDPSHRTGNGVPSAQQLHGSSVDVLKALTTYHGTYHAVYRHDIGSRLPLLKHPVLATAREADPNIVELDKAAAAIPRVQKARFARADGPDVIARALNAFLDA